MITCSAPNFKKMATTLEYSIALLILLPVLRKLVKLAKYINWAKRTGLPYVIVPSNLSFWHYCQHQYYAKYTVIIFLGMRVGRDGVGSSRWIGLGRTKDERMKNMVMFS